MLDKEIWLLAIVSVLPENVQFGEYQGSVEFFHSNFGKPSYCAQTHCHAETGLGLLVSVNDKCYTTLCSQLCSNSFREGPSTYVMFRCPQAFAHALQRISQYENFVCSQLQFRKKIVWVYVGFLKILLTDFFSNLCDALQKPCFLQQLSFIKSHTRETNSWKTWHGFRINYNICCLIFNKKKIKKRNDQKKHLNSFWSVNDVLDTVRIMTTWIKFARCFRY